MEIHQKKSAEERVEKKNPEKSTKPKKQEVVQPIDRSNLRRSSRNSDKISYKEVGENDISIREGNNAKRAKKKQETNGEESEEDAYSDNENEKDDEEVSKPIKKDVQP